MKESLITAISMASGIVPCQQNILIKGGKVYSNGVLGQVSAPLSPEWDGIEAEVPAIAISKAMHLIDADFGVAMIGDGIKISSGGVTLRINGVPITLATKPTKTKGNQIEITQGTIDAISRLRPFLLKGSELTFGSIHINNGIIFATNRSALAFRGIDVTENIILSPMVIKLLTVGDVVQHVEGGIVLSKPNGAKIMVRQTDHVSPDISSFISSFDVVDGHDMSSMITPIINGAKCTSPDFILIEKGVISGTDRLGNSGFQVVNNIQGDERFGLNTQDFIEAISQSAKIKYHKSFVCLESDIRVILYKVNI